VRATPEIAALTDAKIDENTAEDPKPLWALLSSIAWKDHIGLVDRVRASHWVDCALHLH
jgi:hypothetical protein